LRTRINAFVQNLLLRRGYRIQRKYPIDISNEVVDTIERIAPRSGYSSLPVQISPERFAALCNAVEYVIHHDIPGSIVECGVFRGASMMAAAHTLVRLGRTDRDLYLFDTFEGMSEPTDRDVTVAGARALDFWRDRRTERGADWCFASLEDVRANMRTTRYDESRIHYVKGMVEDTLPEKAPSQIALLRLDTDWYESTRHELVHLFPRLSVGGILLIDDYGHWEGARKAVDEYLEEHKVRLFLARIDYTARIAVKQDATV
jgi:predicted O-methyltransferase YrrM